MKLVLLFGLVALAAAAVPRDAFVEQPIELGSDAGIEYNSILITILLRQLFNFLRNLINNGSESLGVQVLDPLVIEQTQISIPSGIVNLNLDLKKVVATGLGDFVVDKSDLDLRELTFDVQLTIPALQVEAEQYDLLGDIYAAIPLYGKGRALFKANDLTLKAKFFLKQSDDGKSVLIDRIERSGVDIPHFESNLTGVIGGGDIDAIVNSVVEEVLIGYVNRFHGAVGNTLNTVFYNLLNPLLEGLDTWRFLAPLLPRD